MTVVNHCKARDRLIGATQMDHTDLLSYLRGSVFTNK